MHNRNVKNTLPRSLMIYGLGSTSPKRKSVTEKTYDGRKWWKPIHRTGKRCYRRSWKHCFAEKNFLRWPPRIAQFPRHQYSQETWERNVEDKESERKASSWRRQSKWCCSPFGDIAVVERPRKGYPWAFKRLDRKIPPWNQSCRQCQRARTDDVRDEGNRTKMKGCQTNRNICRRQENGIESCTALR